MPEIDLQSLPLKENLNLSDLNPLSEIKCCLKQITETGIRDVIAFNLTRQGLDFPVVKILIPGIEFIPWVDHHCEGKNPEIRRLAKVP